MTTKTIGELLADLRADSDRKDELNAELKNVNGRMFDTELALMRALKDSGQVKAADDYISVTLGQKWRAKCEPDKWDSVLRKMVEMGYGHVFHRRMTDAKVLELIELGVPMPEGLSVEVFDNLSFRRNNSPAK